MQKLVHESELYGLVLCATLTFCIAFKTALLSHIVAYYYLFEKTQEAHSFIQAQYTPPFPQVCLLKGNVMCIMIFPRCHNLVRHRQLLGNSVTVLKNIIRSAMGLKQHQWKHAVRVVMPIFQAL